jgi:hypothetical protein
MNVLDKYTLVTDACKRIKYAASRGMWDGRSTTLYFESCRWLLERFPATIVYTKEEGYHSGGWWKNPDYERCWHLSISFRSGSEKKALSEILEHLFGQYQNLLWVEPPYSDQGKSMNVWHYRLFCDEHWQPIKPRGEVYNTHFTERGWKSFSEVNAKP